MSTSSRALAPIRAIVLTFDLDFGDVLALGVLDKPTMIIFRLSNERAPSLKTAARDGARERFVDLESGSLILVEDTRYRVRKLPIGEPINRLRLRLLKSPEQLHPLRQPESSKRVTARF